MDLTDAVDLEWSHYAMESRRLDATSGRRRLPDWAQACLVKMSSGTAKRQSWFVAYMQHLDNELETPQANRRLRKLREWGLLKRAGAGWYRLSAKGRQAIHRIKK